MRIALHKLSNDRHLLEVDRGGRLEQIDCETRSYLVHDLGFWGLLASGRTLDEPLPAWLTAGFIAAVQKGCASSSAAGARPRTATR